MKNLYKKIFLLFCLLFSVHFVSVAQCTYTVPFSGNNTITASSGTICDHAGTGSYSNNANGYTVINPVSGAVRLTFTAFSTESGWDYVTIFNGVGTGGTVLYNGSGAALPPVTTSTTGPLTIRFTSDGSVISTGFTATISNVALGGGCNYTVPFSGNNTISASSGTICDHAGTGSYTNGANGFTIINPVIGGQMVRLTFASFNLECCCDFVTVFNGAGTGGPVLFNGNCNTLPPVLTSTTGPLTIRFTSDGSVVGTGFSANISNVVATYDPCTSIVNVPSICTNTTTSVLASAGAYNPPASTCGFSTPGQEKIFTFTPPATGQYRIQQSTSIGYVDWFYKTAAGGCSGTGWTCLQDLLNNTTSGNSMTLTGGTQYYLMLDPESTTAGSITFSVQPVLNPPTAVTANPSTINCAGANVNLNATTTAGNVIRWFTVASGGTTLGTSNSGANFVVTPAGTTTYYAETYNATCLLASATRTPVTVTLSQPAPTAVTATPNSFCQGVNPTVQLNATNTGGTITWWDAPSGGTQIGSSASGANFAVNPTVTTTYYAESAWPSASSQSFSYTGSIQNFTVPAGVTSITINARGGQGGAGGSSPAGSGGLGANMTGTFTVTPGQVLKVLVGRMGQGSAATSGAGGGGGTYVTDNANTPLIVAGGGGGRHGTLTPVGIDANTTTNGNNGYSTPAGYAGNYGIGGTGGNGATNNNACSGNGAGLLSNGSTNSGCCNTSFGYSFVNLGTAGASCTGNIDIGGYGGGGGGGNNGAGGGGGYSGGGGSYHTPTNGGGGGSYNAGTSQANTVNGTGDGLVTITWFGSSCGSPTRTPVTVTVNPLPTLSVSTTPSPATVCAGNTVTLTASGNASTYTWTDGSNTPTNGTAFTPAGSSVYTVTATSATGCITTTTVAVTVNPLPTLSASTTPSPATVCAGNTVTLTASGNASTYTWTDGGNTPANGTAFTPAGSSVYTVTATSAAGCTTTATASVTVNSLPVLTAAASPAPCNGGNGAITFSATGNGAMSFTVNGNPQSSPYAASAGTYTIAVTDANGCSASGTVTVSEPSALSMSITKYNYNGSDISCATAADGGFFAGVSGGTPNYTYSLNGGAFGGSSTFSSLGAGVYTITVMDANNCTLSTTVSIVAPAAVVLSLSATNALCNTGNGSLNFSATGGTGAVSYTVNGNAQTSPFATPAGNYTVVATDANGCSVSSTAVITQPLTGVVVSMLAAVDPTCTSTGLALVNGTGGTGALVYSINPNIGTQVVAGTFSGLTAQAYTITATDANGCTATTNFTLFTPPLPSVTVSSVTPILCNGGSSTITVSGTGGTPSYTYNLNGGTYAASNIFTGNTAGVYNISVKDANNCTGTTSVTIIQPSAVSVSASAAPIACSGGTTGITVVATGGTAGYQYQLNAGGYQPSATFNGVAAGNYTITAQDANGCTSSTTLTISQPTPVTATVVASTNVSCNGGSNGSATASGNGGTLPYGYAWTPTGGSLATAGSLAFGNYTVTITDANGCSASSNVSIGQPAAVTVTASATNALCNGGNGTLNFSASGGTGTFTYTVNNNPQLSPFAAPQGTYTVIATDGSGCTGTATQTIGQPTSVAVSATAGTILCFGGNTTLTASASGGTGGYLYSLNGGTPQAGTTFSGVTAGTYTLTATDANGCSAATVGTITQPTVLAISTVSPSSCPNQSVILAAAVSGGTPGYSYLWSVLTLNGSGIGANTPFNNDGINHGESTSSTMLNPDFDTHQISNGMYGLSVVVTDTNGCTDTSFFTITVQQGPITTITASTAGAVCFGDTVTYSVPAVAVNGNYVWMVTNGTIAAGGGNTNTVTVAWNNASTPNTVGVTVTENSCVSTNTISVTVNPTPVLIVTNPAPVCAPSTVDITAPAVTAGTAPGLTLSYHTNAAATLTFLTPTTAGTGTYYIKASDLLGCDAVQPVSVLVNPQPVLSTSVTNALCNTANGQITFSATGAPSLVYTVNGTPQASPMAVSAGSYTVVATDGNACSASTILTVTEPAAINLSTSASSALCNGGNGSLTFSAGGGTGSISFTVNGNSQVSPFSTIAGTYTIVATDANLCSASATVTITEPAAIVVTAGSSNPLCNAANGQLTFSATGGAGAINFTVNGLPQISPFTTAAGTYTIVATDANLCTVSTVQTVTAPSAVTLTATAGNALCNGASGSLNLSATGGTGTLTYTINGNAASAGSNAVAAGTYTVVASDANNCSASTVLAVTQPAALSIGFPVTLQSGCFGTNNGIFQLIGTTGGTTPYTYSSSPVLTQPIAGTFTGVTNGSVYTITATDLNNCAMTTTVILGNPQVTVTASSTVILCNGGSSDITSLAVGGTGTFTYSLNGGTSQAVGLFAANLPGTYTVVASDANNCSASTTLTITQPAALTLSASATAPICSGGNGTLDFSAGGGTPGYTYTVNGTSATSPYSTVSGNYTIVATDANACSLSTVITMSSPTPVTVSATSTASSICLGGSVTFTAVGNGTSYTWSDGSNTPTDGVAFTPLSAGTSTYTVTATSGACTSTSTINLTVHGVGSFTAPVTLTAACPEAPGSSITIGSTGAAAPVNYSIEPNYPTSPIPGIFNGLIGGASYTITLTDANGCSASTTLNAPSASANGELANAGSANTSSTPGNSCKAQFEPDGAAMSFYGADCHDLIAKVDDALGGNVLGNVNACVTVTPGVQTYNGQPYIRRSYVITPQNQGPATLTFYFTHEDITGYNANAGSYPQISIPGPVTNGSTISFLCSQVPQNLLPGAPGANTILHNVTASWNAVANRWEAVIPVTGFSGFYFHTGSLPLPVMLTKFEGRKQANSNLLEWSTSSEQNNAYFNLQHSSNGTDFSTVAKLESKAANGNSSSTLNYHFEHTQPQAGHNYYRLQQVDLDNQSSLHAKVIDLMWGAEGNSISIYPNPTREVLNIDVYSTRVENTVVKVLDMSGRVVKQIQARTEAGMNHLTVSLGELADGMYTIHVFENQQLTFVGKVNKTQ